MTADAMNEDAVEHAMIEDVMYEDAVNHTAVMGASAKSAVDSGAAVKDAAVNYDCDAVLETQVGGVQYRLDSGMQGTALCISQREAGEWDWKFVGEAKWDAVTLRCKAVERAVCEQLARELRQVE